LNCGAGIFLHPFSVRLPALILSFFRFHARLIFLNFLKTKNRKFYFYRSNLKTSIPLKSLSQKFSVGNL